MRGIALSVVLIVGAVTVQYSGSRFRGPVSSVGSGGAQVRNVRGQILIERREQFVLDYGLILEPENKVFGAVVVSVEV